MLAAGAAVVGATLPFTVHAQPAHRMLSNIDTIGPEPEGADFYRMSLSPDGRTMLTIRNHAPTGATLWDLAARKPRKSLTVDSISDVHFVGNRAAITVDFSDRVRHWDLTDGQAVRSIIPSGPRINDAAVSSDGRIMVLGQDRLVSVWDLKRGIRIGGREDADQGAIERVRFSAAGRLLACAHLGSLRVYDLATLALIAEWPTSISVGGTAFSADGRLIFQGEDERIKVFDIAGKRQVASIEKLGPERDFFYSVAPFRNGEMFAAIDDHGRFLVGSLAARTFVARSREDAPKATRLAMSPDQRLAYVGNVKGEIVVYDLSSVSSSWS
jgi:WD40 repeat protein